MTGPGARRTTTLALAAGMAATLLLFSQRFYGCFPAPKLLALALAAGVALAAAAGAGLLGAAARAPFTPPLLAVVGMELLGLAAAGSPDTAALTVLPVGAAALTAWLAYAVGRFPAERGRLVGAFVLAHLACGAYAGLQYFGGDPWTWSVDYGTGRVFSTLGNPNFLAGQLALALPVLAALALTGRPAMRWTAAAAFIAALLGMILAQTRGAWLGLFAGCVVAALAARRLGLTVAGRRPWLVPALAALVLGVVFSVPALNPTRISLPAQLASSATLDQQSARQRFFWWTAGAVLLRAAPLAGCGTGNFVREFPARARAVLGPYSDLPAAYCDHPHQDYLFVACEHGLLGLGLLLWLAATWLRLAWQGARRGRSPALGILAGAVALAGHAAWNMPSIISATLVAAGLLLGLAAALAGPDEPDGTDTPFRAGPALAGLAVALLLARRPATLLTANAYLNGARILKETGGGGGAAFLARRTLALTQAPWRTHFLLGGILYGQRYYTEALDAFQRDEAENPWGADAILHQGKALRELGRYAEADAASRRALALVPNYPEAAVTIASLAYFRADTARRAGRRAEMAAHLQHARVWLTYALRYFPRHAEALKLSGFTAVMERRWDDAAAWWTRALRANPRDDGLRAKLELLLADLPRLKAGGAPR